MSEIKVGRDPVLLACIGLGSCIGVVLYDPEKRIGGLAHVMLPGNSRQEGLVGKFVNTAIEEMIKEMKTKGADKKRIRAKIFGGANMFPSLNSRTILLIGERNIKAVREELKKWEIPLVAKDVGGTEGRTIIFNTHDGKVTMKTLKGKEVVY